MRSPLALTLTMSRSLPASPPSAILLFYDCPKLTPALFRGDPPALGESDVFFHIFYPTVVYYLPLATRWETTFGGCPAVCWNPVTQSASFTASSDQFGFTVTGNATIPVLVEACTNLSEGAWAPVETNSLGASGTLDFIDAKTLDLPTRFYRVVWP